MRDGSKNRQPCFNRFCISFLTTLKLKADQIKRFYSFFRLLHMSLILFKITYGLWRNQKSLQINVYLGQQKKIFKNKYKKLSPSVQDIKNQN